MVFEKKILIVGFGSIGKRHYNNLKTIGYENISIVRSGKGSIKAGMNDDDKIYYDLDEALKTKPEIVFITNPTSYHIDSALKAAEAGCHIFIEKPVSNSFNKCDKLLAIIEEKKLITMVGFQFRYHPLLLGLKSMINESELGDIFYVNSFYGEYLPDWHPWEDYKVSYSAKDDLGGGVILTLSHPIDYLLWLFGEIDKIQSLYKKSKLLKTNVPDDIADINILFKSGQIGHVHLDYVRRPPAHFLEVFGEKKSVKIDFLNGVMRTISKKGKIKEKFVNSSYSRNDMYLSELKHFFNSINLNIKTDISLEHGLKSLEVCLLAKEGI
jgi:predicted dehydrogenase